MTVSSIAVDDATTPDKYLHTNQRTISAVARDDQFVLPGEIQYPTYNVIANNISIATTDSHVLQIMGDGTNYSRVRRIEIAPFTATSMGILRLLVYRLSTAGTGGSAVTIAGHDSSDTYAGAAATLPTAKGTEGALLHAFVIGVNASTPTMMPQSFVWEEHQQAKPFIFGPATTNGIAFKVVAGLPAGTVYMNVEIVTTSYL